MRILIVGAGATGGYFGARLAQAGRDVSFLVRPARAERLRQDGLHVHSPLGDVHLQPTVITADQIDDPFDVVVLAVKAFALPAALDDMRLGIGRNTAILPLLNGMRHLDRLAERFGEAAVLGGVCRIMATLDEAGHIHQLTRLHQLSYGERDGHASSRLAALDAQMQGAGFDAAASNRILDEMWEKWAFLASLGAITCLMRGTIGEVAAVPGGDRFARAVLEECGAVAQAAGHPLGTRFRESNAAMLTAAGSSMTSSMYRDLVAGQAVEAEQVLGDLVERAQGFGLEVPLLSAAFTHLSVYQARREA